MSQMPNLFCLRNMQYWSWEHFITCSIWSIIYNL